jgi:regulator of sigma E protease
MSTIFTIIYALAGFIVLVFFHEFGHFLLAKLGRVGVEEFAVGMGKPIWKKRWKKTLYRINIFPIGGYCKLKGQDDFGPAVISGEKDNFYNRPAWVRFLVSLGGPSFSYLLGFLFLSLAFFYQGDLKIQYTQISTTPNHEYFQDGDRILSINGEKVSDWKALQTQLMKNNNQTIDIRFERSGKTYRVKNYHYKMEQPEIGLYGNDYPEIIKVLEKSPAAKAGLEPGDVILSINQHPIRDEFDMIHWVQNSSLPLKVQIKRYENLAAKLADGFRFDFFQAVFPRNAMKLYESYQQQNPLEKTEIITKSLVPDMRDNRKVIGVVQYVDRSFLRNYSKRITYPFPEALAHGFNQSFNVISLSYHGIVQLIQGDMDIQENVAGPVKIFKSLGEAGSEGGFFTFLSFAGIISLALAFFNFLPFPALDGGHMVLSLIEMITRKRVNPKVISVLQFVGILFLLGMLLLVTINDIFG